MLNQRSREWYTLFNKMMVLSSRFDFLAIYDTAPGFVLCCTNKASDFNEMIEPGKIIARIIFGKFHTMNADADTAAEMREQAKRYNETLSQISPQ